MLSPAGRFYSPRVRSFRSRKACDRSAPCAGLALDARDGVTAMADNITQWSASDAVDRLRVAIERQQAATERQTATTRWLNVVMTSSNDPDGSPSRRPVLALCSLGNLARRSSLASLVVARAVRAAHGYEPTRRRRWRRSRPAGGGSRPRNCGSPQRGPSAAPPERKKSPADAGPGGTKSGRNTPCLKDSRFFCHAFI